MKIKQLLEQNSIDSETLNALINAVERYTGNGEVDVKSKAVIQRLLATNAIGELVYTGPMFRYMEFIDQDVDLSFILKNGANAIHSFSKSLNGVTAWQEQLSAEFEEDVQVVNTVLLEQQGSGLDVAKLASLIKNSGNRIPPNIDRASDVDEVIGFYSNNIRIIEQHSYNPNEYLEDEDY